jgi:hypothetical protein
MPQDMVARKPADLTFEQAGPTPAFTLQALRDAGSVKSGQRVLIVESSGAVGLFALQMSFAGVARLGTGLRHLGDLKCGNPPRHNSVWGPDSRTIAELRMWA